MEQSENDSPRELSPREYFRSLYDFDPYEETEMFSSDWIFDRHGPLHHPTLHNPPAPETAAPDTTAPDTPRPDTPSHDTSSNYSDDDTSDSDFDETTPDTSFDPISSADTTVEDITANEFVPRITLSQPTPASAPVLPPYFTPSHPFSYTPPRPRHFSSPSPLFHQAQLSSRSPDRKYSCGFPACRARDEIRMKQKRLKLFTPESLARHYLHHHATLECKLQGTEKCKKAPWQRITHLHIAANGKRGKMTENETVWLMCGCESEFNWSDGEAVDLLNEWIGNGDCVAYERGEGGWVEWGMVQREKQLDGRYMKGFKGRLKDKDREEMARARMEELELKTWSHIVAEGDEVDQKEYDRNKIAKAEVKLNKLHDEMENFVLRRRPSFRAREPKRRFYKFHFPGLL